MEQLTYRLDQFEGPLDLLLTLISKNKVSIEYFYSVFLFYSIVDVAPALSDCLILDE